MSLEAANALFEEKKYAEAAVAYEEVAKSIEPKENPLIYCNLGRCFHEVEDYAAAIDNYKKANRGCMANKEALDALARQSLKFSLAQCFEKTNKLRLAKVYYEDANA